MAVSYTHLDVYKRQYLGRAPWYALFVGLAIVLMILGLSLLTEGLQQRRRS